MEEKELIVHWRKREYIIPMDKILYVKMKRNNAEIHVYGDKVYRARRIYTDIKPTLGDRFIEVKRGCMVSAMAIYRFKKKLELINGDKVGFTVRKKKALVELLCKKQQEIIEGFSKEGVPTTPEEYRRHYSGFDDMPFAFADIEMVFNKENKAVDWIFRYGNEALARIEKLPLEQLIGSSFSSLFPKMDTKWLFNYGLSAIYGENLEIIDYSPEVKTTLKIISFPTFEGHCGCILFDVSDIRLTNKDGKCPREYLGISAEPVPEIPEIPETPEAAENAESDENNEIDEAIENEEDIENSEAAENRESDEDTEMPEISDDLDITESTKAFENTETPEN